MVDLARLGLVVDSGSVKSGTADLDRFAASGNKAGAAANGLRQASANAAPAAQSLARSAGVASTQLELAGRRAGAIGSSLGNLSFQINDIASGLAMGQSPFTILAQQGGQVFQIYQQNNNVFRDLGSVITRVVTPMRLLGLGVVAVGAAGVAAAISWRTFALALDDTARRAGTTTSEMAKLQAAAGFKGIDQGEFAGGIGKFATQVLHAKTGVGELAELFRFYGLSVRDTSDALAKIADLVKNAANDQQRLNILAQAGLPATMQWVRLLENGSVGLKKATDQATAFGGAANDNMVKKAREFDEAWNKATTNLGLYFRSAGGEAVSWLDRMIARAARFAQLYSVEGIRKLGQELFPGPPKTATQTVASRFPTAAETFKPFTPAPPPGETKDEQIARLQRYQQQIGLLGELATADERVKQAEGQLRLAFLQSGASIGARREALLNMVRAQAEAAKLSQQVQFGVFDATRQEANARRELQVLIDTGDISTTQAAADAWAVYTKRLREAKDTAAVAKSPFEQLTRMQQEGANTLKAMDQFGVNSLRSFEDALVDLGTGAKSAADAFKAMTDSIIRDLLRLMIRQSITGPLAGALSEGLKGFFAPTAHTGGIVGNLSGGRYIHPAYFDDIAVRHKGGMVGTDERLVLAKNDEGIFTPAQMKALGGGSTTIINKIDIQNNAQGVEVQERQKPGGGTELIIRHIDRGLTDLGARGQSNFGQMVSSSPSGSLLRGV